MSTSRRRRGTELLLFLGLFFFRNHYFTGNDGRDMNEKSPLPQPVAVSCSPSPNSTPISNYDFSQTNASFSRYWDFRTSAYGLAEVLGQ